MKALIFSLLFPIFCSAQQIVLLDRGFKEPMRVTNTITTGDLLKGWFPIHIKDVDSIVKKVAWFQKYINTGQRHENESIVMNVGNTNFISQVEKQGNSNNYYIVLNTTTGNYGATMLLVKKRDSKKRALQKLNIFIDYLRNNMSVLEEDERYSFFQQKSSTIK